METSKNTTQYKYRGNGFTFWCDLFHKKYHSFRDSNSGITRQHFCRKCIIYYVSPNLSIKENEK